MTTHTKFETTYSYDTMNILFKSERGYVVIKAEDISKHLMMDIAEFFDFGHIDSRLEKVALRLSANSAGDDDHTGDDTMPDDVREYLENLEDK